MGIMFDTISVFTTNSGGAITLIGNSFVGGNAKTEQGIGGEVNGGGINFALGDINPADANIFTANRNAHIGLILDGASQNNFTIDRHNLSGALVGNDNTYSGNGVAFILRDSATLTGFIQRSTIQQNQGDGILMTATSTDPVNFAQINNFVIGGATAGLGNTITNNGLSGIDINRSSNAQVNNMQILNNNVSTNGTFGIFLTTANAAMLPGGIPFQDTYTVNNNTVNTNSLDGIRLSTIADGNMNINMDSNTINGNGTNTNGVDGSGIHTVEQVNSSGDVRDLIGTWTRNTITNNALDGIDLNSALGNIVTSTPLIIGDPT
jgi:hypothetical protein